MNLNRLDWPKKMLYFGRMSKLIHILDISGAILAFISTLYFVKADILAWPSGVISCMVDFTLFALTGIYGDMGLEVIYFISMFYGWYVWTHPKKNQQELPISSITNSQFWTLGSITLTSIALLTIFLGKFTNSQVPLWDASTTVLSIMAQWMICKKIIECWYVWFTVDFMYVGLYFHKGIPAHGILFMIYLGLAIAGFLNWRRLMGQSAKSQIDAVSA